MIESIVSGRGLVEDHNWNRKKQRSSVQMVGDVSALYYPEKETGGSTRPAQRVIAIEDLWDTLVGVDSQLSHGGRQRMEKYLIEHGTHVPRPVIPGGFADGTRWRIQVYPQLSGLLQQVRHPASAQDQDSG